MVERCAPRRALLIHENWRWQPWYREANRLISQDRLGRVFHFGFRMRTGDGRGPPRTCSSPIFARCHGCCCTKLQYIFWIPFAFWAGSGIDLLPDESDQPRDPRRRLHAGAGLLSSGAKGMIDANRISGASPPEVAFGEFRIEGTSAIGVPDVRRSACCTASIDNVRIVIYALLVNCALGRHKLSIVAKAWGLSRTAIATVRPRPL